MYLKIYPLDSLENKLRETKCAKLNYLQETKKKLFTHTVIKSYNFFPIIL